MAPPVTEFASLSLKPGVDLKGKDAPILDQAYATLLATPGCQRIYWGTKVEDPTNMQMIIDWETHEAHMTFTKDPSYGPFVAAISPILAGPPNLMHIAFEPHPPTKGLSQSNAPTTEILTIYVDKSLSSADREKISSGFAKLGGVLEGLNTGFRGANGGWLVEEDVDYEKAEGGKASAFRGVIGWDSVEAHMATRETQEFKDNIHVVRQAPGLLGLDVFHIHSNDVTPH